MVSDKDRAAAIEAANNAFDAWHERDGSLAAAMVDGLIALDWGPRPTVAKEDLVGHVARIEAINAPVVNGAITLNAESMADALIPFLRECGIEVTDE